MKRYLTCVLTRLNPIPEEGESKVSSPNLENHTKPATISTAEKAKDQPATVDHGEPAVTADHYVDSFTADPFKPFADLPDERARVLTFRAVLVGLIAGALVNASNV